MHPGAEHVPVVPFQRILPGQSVVSGERHRLLDRADGGPGRDELGDGGMAGHRLVTRDREREGTQQAMNRAFATVLKALGYKVSPFGAGGASLVTEPRRSASDQQGEFTATLDVVEPMGMETMVYFSVDGQEICGRVEPGSAAGPGEIMTLYANMEHMHLIDPQTGAVL